MRSNVDHITHLESQLDALAPIFTSQQGAGDEGARLLATAIVCAANMIASAIVRTTLAPEERD